MMAAVAAILAAGFLFPPLFIVGQWLLVILAVLVAADVLALYTVVRLSASRSCAGTLAI